jgi:hypothetical protein
MEFKPQCCQGKKKKAFEDYSPTEKNQKWGKRKILPAQKKPKISRQKKLSHSSLLISAVNESHHCITNHDFRVT